MSTTKNITCVGVSPDGNVAIVVDEGWTDGNNSCELCDCPTCVITVCVCVSQMALPCW